MSFYNTTNEGGQILLDFKRAAAYQDNLVLDMFKRYNVALTPSECYRKLLDQKLIEPSVPITSIRRSITNLTRDERLEKLPGKRVGPHGRPEYTWKYIHKIDTNA